MGHVVAFFDIMKTHKSIRNYLPMGGPLFVYDECRLKLQDRFATAGPDGVPLSWSWGVLMGVRMPQYTGMTGAAQAAPGYRMKRFRFRTSIIKKRKFL